MDLAIPSFIIAVVGIAIQFADAFPDHREARKTIVIMSIGIFLGVGIDALLGAKYNVTGNIDAKFALLFAILACIVVFALLGALLSDPKKREAAGVASWALVVLFLLSGFGVALSYATPQRSVTVDERLMLSASAERRGDYDKAIEHLKDIQSAEVTSDGFKQVQNRIAKLEQRRLLPPSP